MVVIITTSGEVLGDAGNFLALVDKGMSSKLNLKDDTSIANPQK